MKNIVIILVLIATGLSAALAFDRMLEDMDETALEHAKKHADPTYVCPMHPQITDDIPSECPICGMDLELREAAVNETALEHAKKHADPGYVCPMHPQITSDDPGSCPICGMDLEQREAETSSDGETVRISPAMINNLGVRLQHVDRGKVSEQVYASGYVTKVADSQQQDIDSKVTGRIVDILVTPGQWVEEDQVLMTIEVEGFRQMFDAYVDAMDNSRVDEALQLHRKLSAMGASNETAKATQEHVKIFFMRVPPHSLFCHSRVIRLITVSVER